MTPRTTEGTDALVETVREGISVPDSHLANGFAITRHDDAQRALSSLSDIIEGLERERDTYKSRADMELTALEASGARNVELERVVEAARDYLGAEDAVTPGEWSGRIAGHIEDAQERLTDALAALSQPTEDAAFVHRTRQAVQDQREEGDAE